MSKIHARKSAITQGALCGTRAPHDRIILGGAFAGTVTCAHCKRMHISILNRRQKRHDDISDIFDRRMFNEIAPLDDSPTRQGLAEITCRGSLVRLRQTAWDYADSKALHEWLGRALQVSGSGT